MRSLFAVGVLACGAHGAATCTTQAKDKCRKQIWNLACISILKDERASDGDRKKKKRKRREDADVATGQ